MTTKVHIVGVGNIGCFVAHALRSLPDPPKVVLNFHRRRQIDRFIEHNGEISYIKNRYEYRSSDYETEFYRARPRSLETFGGKDMSHIRHCIVATKADDVVPAMTFVHKRMNRYSTVVLLQNGMGTLEKLQRLVFTSPEDRPNILVGVNTHGCYSDEPFNVVHAGVGTILLGLARHPLYPEGFLRDDQACTPELLEKNPYTTSAAEILELFHASDLLSSSSVSFTELTLAQLEKLAINSAINSVTALIDCLNGDLLEPPVFPWLQSILGECSRIYMNLPIIKALGKRSRFTKFGLLQKVLEVAKATASNKSSMLQDIQRRRNTEVEYLNGYLIKLGKQVNVFPRNNVFLRRAIIAKSRMAASGRTVFDRKTTSKTPFNTSEPVNTEIFTELCKQD